MSSPALSPRPASSQPSRTSRDQSWRQLPQHRPAVNAYARNRYQQQQTGTWAPFTGTAPVRDHVDQLRGGGMTSEQIAKTSGISVSTVTRLFKVNRMTTVAAEAILAIPAPTPTAPDEPGAEPRPDPTGQLRALVADGWSLTQLADAAGIDEQTAYRTVHGYTNPSKRTTTAVNALYEQLRLDDPGDGTPAIRARARAQRDGWTPTSGDPSGNGRTEELVDQVAVDRAVAGRPVPLRAVEQQAVLRRLAGAQPDDEIARRLGLATRTVTRHRLSQGLPAYAPLLPIAGPAR